MGLQIRLGTTCLMVATSYRASIDKVGDGVCMCVQNQPENKNERNNIYDYQTLCYQPYRICTVVFSLFELSQFVALINVCLRVLPESMCKPFPRFIHIRIRISSSSCSDMIYSTWCRAQ